MTEAGRQVEAFAAFWNFLAYLREYVNVAKDLVQADTDPGRTRLLSTLTEYMRHVLRADMTFVGYRDLENGSSEWLHLVKDTVTPEQGPHWQSALIKRLDKAGWRLPYDGLDIVQTDSPAMLFDQGLEKLPELFRGVVTALAVSRVVLLRREYFLFFCDIEGKSLVLPRYSDFDRVMLTVATGILEIGFQSGVRGGRKVQQDFEEAQTRQFLLDLAHELKTPIQAVLADASNLQTEMPAEWAELHELAARNLSAAHHLSLLVDTIRMTLAGHELPDESLMRMSVEKPLEEAVNMFIGDARVKGLQILPIRMLDGQPFPLLPMYVNQLTIAFKNLIHNAIVYSLPAPEGYVPIEVVGHSEEGYYVVDITNYGLEITQEEIEQRVLFKLKYRGKSARQLTASGSGLGLTSAQRIVEKHGGKIEVTSEPFKPPLFRNTFSVFLLTIGPKKKENLHE